MPAYNTGSIQLEELRMGPGWVLTQPFPGLLCITGVNNCHVLGNLGEGRALKVRAQEGLWESRDPALGCGLTITLMGCEKRRKGGRKQMAEAWVLMRMSWSESWLWD